MAISFIAYMPFIVSQLFPHAYTLIPSGLAVGFGKKGKLHFSCRIHIIFIYKFSQVEVPYGVQNVPT